MSHKSGISEWRQAGPLIALMIGTSMFSRFISRCRPSQWMRSIRSIDGRAGNEDVPGVARGPENSGPVPVRMTTRFSRSAPMSWNASGSSPCGKNPQRSDWPSVCSVTWSTPFRRSIRALVYLFAYSPNELISTSVPPELHLFERRRPRVGIDQHQRRLLDPWAHAARPDVVPDRPEPHPLVQELLDLMEQRLAFTAIAHEGLFLVQRVDVGVAAVGIRPVARDVLRHPRGGVAVGRSGADTEPAQLLGL